MAHHHIDQTCLIRVSDCWLKGTPKFSASSWNKVLDNHCIESFSYQKPHTEATLTFSSTSGVITVFGEALPAGSKEAICHSDSHLSLPLSLTVCLSPALPQPFSNQISRTLLPRICAKEISSWAVIATN